MITPTGPRATEALLRRRAGLPDGDPDRHRLRRAKRLLLNPRELVRPVRRTGPVPHRRVHRRAARFTTDTPLAARPTGLFRPGRGSRRDGAADSGPAAARGRS